MAIKIFDQLPNFNYGTVNKYSISFSAKIMAIRLSIKLSYFRQTREKLRIKYSQNRKKRFLNRLWCPSNSSLGFLTALSSHTQMIC